MKLLFAICQGGGDGDVREGRWNIGYSRGKNRGTGCFNGPTPCGILWLEALRGTFEIRPSSWECGGETRGEGDTEKYQRICGIVINLRCSAFRGMNWGPCIEGKKFQNPGKDAVQAVELRKAVEEVGVLV